MDKPVGSQVSDRQSRAGHVRVVRSVVLAGIVSSGIGACGPISGGGPQGSGRVVTETRAVSGFAAIDLRGIGQVVLTVGQPEALTVEAEDNLLAEISTTVSGDTLILELKQGRPMKPIVYWVTARQVTSLSTSGAGDIEAAALATSRLRTSQSGAGNIRLGQLDAQELESSLAGAGSLDVRGTAPRFVATISGVGKINARELAVRDAQVTVTGAGDAALRVSDSLRVRISGAGNVEYVGNPRVEREITGLGEVRQVAGS
jgi:hypothetical protein